VLVLGETERHFEVDNDKRGIKVFLDFPADVPPREAPTAAGGYQLTLLNLATPATGSLWLEGMVAPEPLAGHVLLRHAWFPLAEHELIRSRLDVAVLDPAAPLFLSEIQPREGGPWRWLVAGEETWQGGPGTSGGLDLQVRERRGGDYPVPTRINLRGKGLEGRVTLGRTLLEVDPLDALPTLLRMVYSFGGRPRHQWLEADAEVALKSPAGDAVLRWQGDGIAKLVHLESTPRDR
jgi:hypothetical protein